jgi:hypothetical protein
MSTIQASVVKLCLYAGDVFSAVIALLGPADVRCSSFRVNNGA